MEVFTNSRKVPSSSSNEANNSVTSTNNQNPLNCLPDFGSLDNPRNVVSILTKYIQRIKTEPGELEKIPAAAKVNLTFVFEYFHNMTFPHRSNTSQLETIGHDLATAMTELGESPYPLEALNEKWQVNLTILYSLTAITSFLLNVMTVIVLTRIKSKVLSKYLINLSVSDLLMSLFSIRRWIFWSFLCPFVRFIVTLSVFVSAATMTAIGIDRYFAIVHPIQKKNNSKLKQFVNRKNRVIITIWLVGITISTPEYLMFNTEAFCHNYKKYFACVQVGLMSISTGYSIFIYMSTFTMPLTLLSYLNTRIALTLWRHRIPGNVDANTGLSMQTKRVKSIKLLSMVVVVFAISWLPLQTFSLTLHLYPEIRETEYQSFSYHVIVGSFFACHWLSMFHSCLNPLIYCFMNDKFRLELDKLMCKRGSNEPASGDKGPLDHHPECSASQSIVKLSQPHRGGARTQSVVPRTSSYRAQVLGRASEQEEPFGKRLIEALSSKGRLEETIL